MSVRQYIGARYVPKFYENSSGNSNWTPNTAYEPLTIVLYNQNNYTSKKAVPATVGNPAENPEYWVNTGTYDAQIAQLTQRVNTIDNTKIPAIESDIDNIEDRMDDADDAIEDLDGRVDALETGSETGITLIVADSYGSEMYGGWVPKLVTKLGMQSGEYADLTVLGSCFSDGSWLNSITQWATEHPTDVQKVTRIICGGGINDSTSGALQNLSASIINFISYAKATFNPNVRVMLAYFGWALDDSPILNGRTAVYRCACQKIFANAAEYGGEYLNGVEFVLHNRDYIASDGLHPNTQGANAIADAIVQAIKTGYASINYTTTGIALTGIGCTAMGTIDEYFVNGQHYIKLTGVGFTGGPKSFASAGGVQIANVPLKTINSIGSGYWFPVIYTNAANNANYVGYFGLGISNGVLSMSYNDWDTSANFWKSANISAMNFISIVIPVQTMLN